MPVEPIRGGIYWLDWHPARGSEQEGRRPGLVVQTDLANSNLRYPLTVVVAISSAGRPVPFHVRIEPSESNGLRQVSFAKCEQLLTISKDRLIEQMGVLGEAEMSEVDASLRRVLAL